MEKTLLVTGGAGFIGSNLILKALADTDWRIVNVDKLTYSGNPESLKTISGHPRYKFIQADVADAPAINAIFAAEQPAAVMHLAAESHVDRSIDSPDIFIETNIRGTSVMLEASRAWWKTLREKNKEAAQNFRFAHISTDEVFGDLAGSPASVKFSESTPYAPSSPYSASKAASDHLVRAWGRTYGLPTLITNCSNNYGPRQFPEKLIPVTILNALKGNRLPVYGRGLQIRDWLYVNDHAEALLMVLAKGKPGETYAIGGNCEKRNIDVVEAICGILDESGLAKPEGLRSYAELITFVADRPGHDGRYAIDASKISDELGWKPKYDFASGLRETTNWYLENRDWWQRILDGSYRLERLGAGV